MSYEGRKFEVPLWLLILIGIAVVASLFAILYFKVDASNTKLVGLIGGVVSGLIVFIFTYVSLLKPVLDVDKFHRMGIKGLLGNRHDKKYYSDLVKTAETRVDVTGASCTRFVDDFLDPDSDDKVLVDALNRHGRLKVRLLFPTDEHMAEEARRRLPAMLRKVETVRNRFGDRMQVRRFDDKARHSFVLVDNDLIAGPIFEDDKSKHAPAVHVTTTTAFAQKYSGFFEDVWDRSA